MIANVSSDNTVIIPDEIGCHLGLKPGARPDWERQEGADAILVGRLADRTELARRLCGQGADLASDRDLVVELQTEWGREDQERLRSLGA